MGLLVIATVAVVALAARLGPIPRPSVANQLPGLTYEIEPDAHPSPTLVVTSIEDRGPAFAAGIATGDIIDRIDGRFIKAPRDIGAAVRRDAARGVQLHIRHGGTSSYKRLPVTGI